MTSWRKGPIGVVEQCRDIKAMPDGSPIPKTLRHTLVVLASYSPHVWPSQERLAAVLGISPRQVIRRLAVLEAAGLISRTRRGFKSSQYGLRLQVIRQCDIGVRVDVTSEGHKKSYVKEEEETDPKESGSVVEFETEQDLANDPEYGW